MTRQRQTLVTVTYNDLGCIIDTKAEPYEEPNLQPTCNQFATDTISRQAAIDALARTAREAFNLSDEYNQYLAGLMDGESAIRQLPSAQPEQQWTPSGEKPPKEGSYLIWMPFAPPKHRMAVAEYCGGYWNIKTPISAWMPLPEPYEGNRNG